MHDLNPIIRKSRKAKNMIIKITYDAKVVVTTPHWVANKHVEKFISDKRNWIQERLEQLKLNPPTFIIENGSKIMCMGNELELQIIETKIANTKVFIDSTKILIFSNKFENKNNIKIALIRALKKEFKNKIIKLIEKINIHKQFKYNRIAIKDNRSNWGSCSTKANLNFNWRLVFAPIEVIEYVAIHELCHLKEHNHSAAYWALVASICPDYKKYKNWLKENGHKLSI